MRIIKRNGAEVPYDCEKIRAAITAANDEMDSGDRITDTVIGFIAGNVEKRCEALARPAHVEEVQDMVLDELDKAEAYKLARHYSEYRLLHKQQLKKVLKQKKQQRRPAIQRIKQQQKRVQQLLLKNWTTPKQRKKLPAHRKAAQVL